MILKFLRYSSLFVILIFLNGCFQTTALVGPGITLASTGNIVQAGVQYGANKAIKEETGTDALTYIKNSVEKKNKQKKFEEEFIQFVENRIQNTRKKLSLN
tara:strand:+ start:2269 stop:2571 length:303 start_codon:yes stop_codon:yes gene_type:complete